MYAKLYPDFMHMYPTSVPDVHRRAIHDYLHAQLMYPNVRV